MKLKFSKYNFGHIFTKEQPEYSAGLISETAETNALKFNIFFPVFFLS
jgi:hypothetical protein